MKLEINDTGFLDLKVISAEGETIEKRVDIFDLYNRLAECSDAQLYSELNEARVKCLETLGYGKFSTGAMVQLVEELLDRVNAMKKKGHSKEPVVIPSSTGSPSGLPAEYPTRSCTRSRNVLCWKSRWVLVPKKLTPSWKNLFPTKPFYTSDECFL